MFLAHLGYIGSCSCEAYACGHELSNEFAETNIRITCHKNTPWMWLLGTAQVYPGSQYKGVESSIVLVETAIGYMKQTQGQEH
jgi:hypothetical protein